MNDCKTTPEEYLAWEEKQIEKYEYIDGDVYAMGGGSKNHSLIAVRLTTLIANYLVICQSNNDG